MGATRPNQFADREAATRPSATTHRHTQRSPLAARALATDGLLRMQRAAGNQAARALISDDARSKEKQHKDVSEVDEKDVKEKGKATTSPQVQRLFGRKSGSATPSSKTPSADPKTTGPGIGTDGTKTKAPKKHSPEYKAATVAPKFPLTRKSPKRSNSDSSTTSPKTPKMKGGAAFDSATRTWHYQVKSITSPGTIQIVYYSKSRYPAPGSIDDLGKLSNVTKTNWRAIVADLKANRTGIADAWSAYQAEDLHEDYHWFNEWIGTIGPKFTEAQTEIAALAVPEADAKDATAARKLLEPDALNIFSTKVAEGKQTFWAFGDSEGDPPYIAQAPAIDRLVARIEALAAEKKWDQPEPTTPTAPTTTPTTSTPPSTTSSTSPTTTTTTPSGS